jgi:2-polyprenyl-3-methyl-5-hydroxy-6-metoxy-1,4-benzoquinol methylase
VTQELFGDLKTYSLAGTEQEVGFITKILNIPTSSDILDLYCGYGRHAIELAKQGFSVTGIDATQAFLDIATQKALEEQVPITFRLCDMRELDYSADFDAVINMFAAFGYFTDEENAEVLQRVARALRPGGLFLIDLLNREWMVHNNLNRYWRHPSGEYVLSYKVELQHGVVTMKRVLINQVTETKTQYEFVLRAYSLPEMEAILGKSNLKVRATYGGFDCRHYDSEAPRMIILAQKD